MNRLSILVGWLTLTVIAIGVSSAAVGSVGERVSPQPASVLQAAGDVAALGPGSTVAPTTRATAPPTSTVIDPGDAATAPPPSTTSTAGAGGVTTTAPSPTTTQPGDTTTTTQPGDTTTTTVHDTTTTTVADGSTTTTVPPTTTSTTTAPPTDPTTTTTTTIPEDEIERRTIDSKGGWIRIAWTEERLRLAAAGPRAGFRLDVVENTAKHIVVRFTSRSLDHVSRIVVRLVDGDAKVEVSEFSPDG